MQIHTQSLSWQHVPPDRCWMCSDRLADTKALIDDAETRYTLILCAVCANTGLAAIADYFNIGRNVGILYTANR